MTNTVQVITQHLQTIDPNIFGNLSLNIKNSSVLVTGTIYSNDPLIIDKLSEIVYNETKLTPIISVKTPKSGLSISEERNDRISVNHSIELEEQPLDEVNIIFQGNFPINLISRNDTYKRLNANTFKKIDSAVKVLNFIAPIVLDKDYNIIDGNLRLEIAILNEWKEVPVIVVDANKVKSDYLRLVLNRSNEFQRWIYPEVDNFVDSHPQLQPILEPLGFFGNRILPVSFFGNTVIEYTLDEYNTQQKMYRQEEGLANWAEEMRARRAQEDKKRQELKKKKELVSKSTVSLFDLFATEEDFTPVYNPEEEIAKNVQEMRELAGVITDNYDEVRKAEYAKTGREWQNSRRTSKQLAKDKRALAENKDDVSGENDE